MQIRLGYASICYSISDTVGFKTINYTNYLQAADGNSKLDLIIRHNLETLSKIIDYNIKNNIHFFRISSNIIPLATMASVVYDYITPYQHLYEALGKKINQHNMRVDFHPNEYCILNSTKKEVVSNAVAILEYHYKLITAMNLDKAIILLHIGSSVFGKENASKRFANNFYKLPKEIQQLIAIENDDKIYNVEDTLKLAKELQIPFVLDYHHYRCNKGVDLDLAILKDILSTFNKRPKVHYSSPKNKTKKDFRSHHDYINPFEFITFIENVKESNQDIDIMLEAKCKDEALFRLVRNLKLYTDYKFIDDTTFEV